MRSLQPLRGLVTAVRTLSSIPIPGRDAVDMSAALPFFPLVGGIIGAVLFGLYCLLRLIHSSGWSEGTSLVLVVAGMALTRGIHLDGLADTADGLFSMTDRTRTLAIMKDSRVGTFGVLALITILGLKWISLSRLVAHDAVVWVVPAAVGSRTLMSSLAVLLPYARSEGGCGEPFVKGARPMHLAIAWTIALLCHLPLGPVAPATLAITVAALFIFKRVYTKRIGGITGDLLGAASEITETVILFTIAALVPDSPVINLLKAYTWSI